MTPGSVLDVRQVAEVSGVSAWVVRKWIRAGALPVLPVPGVYRVSIEALTAFLANRDAA